MYYLHKLEHDNFMNLVISTQRRPDYNCKITEMGRNVTRGSVIQDLKDSNPTGVWYPRCNPTYRYKNVEYSQDGLQVALREPHRVVMRRLVDYYSWRQQWPEDLVSYIDGVRVERPKIIRRELISHGDLRYYDNFFIEDFKFDSAKEADQWFRKAQPDDEFILAATGRGPWPMFCGATRDGVEVGDVSKESVYLEN